MTLISSTSKDKENEVTDALSRKIHVMHVTSINTGTPDLKGKIIEANGTNEHY